jgi:hypothetical protein
MTKNQIYKLDGTPEKRLFLSIISDYDLRTGLCELIDNAIDFWTTGGRKKGFTVAVALDPDRQIITIQDNAGGVRESDLRLLISPGASGNKQNQELIGVFGVGGKRAGVALGESVEIRTRFKKENTYQLDINKEWIEEEGWDLAVYEVQALPPGATRVEISKLRQTFTADDVEQIRESLGEIYGKFISEGCDISLNGQRVAPKSFEMWAYPPDYRPRITEFEVAPSRKEEIRVKITAGLITDRVPEAENYGVYFYCNDRLVIKEMRTREVGYFVTGEAGVPHPDASLCRVVVELKGPAELMPWNSSKSGLNFDHPTFLLLRGKLIELVSYFSSLSRRLKNSWIQDVFSYKAGTLEVVNAKEILSARKLVLPVLPRTRRRSRIEEIKEKNSKILSAKPWVLGLVEALGMVEVIVKQNLETKNRAALILLDSNFEIGLKEFIVNRSDIYPAHKYNDAKISEIFKYRSQVIKEVKVHVNLPQTLLDKVNHFYGLRNKLIHERATVGITDGQIADYQATIEQVLALLFDLKFPKLR